MNRDLRVIAVFEYPAMAEVLRTKLESEGIQTTYRDEATIATDPMISQALGGVKLLVHKSDFLRAMALIEQADPTMLRDHPNLIACPHCKKRKVRLQSDIESARGLKQLVKAVALSLMPINSAYNYHCTNCGHKFNLDG
jgi:DNA-directed RNA polymerase subunit RPC12/RpoP